jgi:hypothetical protein
MNSINRFTGLRPPQLPDTQETQDKSVQSSSSPGSSGIAGTPDIYESSQQSDPILSAITARMDAQNNENMVPNTQGESVDASLVFDLLSSNSVAGIPSTPPDLSGLTQPIDGNKGTNSGAASSQAPSLNDAIVKSPGELVDIGSLTAPDGDNTEMYFGWQQFTPKGVVTNSHSSTERTSNSDDEKRKTQGQEEHEKELSADEAYSKQMAEWGTDVFGGKGYPTDDGYMGGPAWLGNPEARRYIHIPGFDGRGESTGNPAPDGGGEEPTTPGPKKTHGGSGDGDDESSSGASGSDAGNYPFVGEEGTIIHPQVNVGSESVVTSVSSDVIQAAYQPDPDDPDGHTPQS